MKNLTVLFLAFMIISAPAMGDTHKLSNEQEYIGKQMQKTLDKVFLVGAFLGGGSVLAASSFVQGSPEGVIAGGAMMVAASGLCAKAFKPPSSM